MKIRFGLSASLFISLLASCSTASRVDEKPVRDDVTVRQVPVGGSAFDRPDGKVWLFVLIPSEPRPLEERISLVEEFLNIEGKCRLGTQNRDVIDDLTRRADGNGQRVLMTPIAC